MRSFDLVSDLHLDAHPDHSSLFISTLQPTSHILVIAGDTFNGFRHKPWQMEALHKIKEKYQNVVIVAGNHDYYGLDFTTVRAAFDTLGKMPGFTFLENEVKEVGGIRFAGTTLWFQYCSDYANDARYFNDFYHIRHFEYAVNNKNEDAKNFLAGIKEGEVDVIITHHLPSYKSVHKKYAAETNNVFYVCPIDEHIERIKAQVACHGHTHELADYYLYDTRVCCNPRGYFGEHDYVYKPQRIEVNV